MPPMTTSPTGPATVPSWLSGLPWRTLPTVLVTAPFACREKFPARVNTCPVPSRSTKNPCPLRARSRLRPVFCTVPWSKSVRTSAMVEPSPMSADVPPLCAEIKSANSVRLALKPTVSAFAMLLPMTTSSLPLLTSPVRPLESAPMSAMRTSFFLRGSVDPVDLVERDALPADEQHGRARRKIHPIDRAAVHQRDGRGGPAERAARGERDRVGPVGERHALAVGPVELERVRPGRLPAQVDRAHHRAAAVGDRRLDVRGRLRERIGDRRRLAAAQRDRAAVVVDLLADEREHPHVDRLLRGLREPAHRLVDVGELLEQREGNGGGRAHARRLSPRRPTTSGAAVAGSDTGARPSGDGSPRRGCPDDRSCAGSCCGWPRPTVKPSRRSWERPSAASSAGRCAASASRASPCWA